MPSAVLFPPQGSYANVAMPSLSSLVESSPAAGPAEAPPAPELPGKASIFALGLQEPRGIAVAEDGRVYVAEGGASKVTIFSPQGEIVGRIQPGAAELALPADVAVSSASDSASDSTAGPGRVYVLDAGAGRLWRYAPDGSDAQEIQADRALLDRSRGLGLGPDGRVWVAATAAGMVAGINAQDGKDEHQCDNGGWSGGPTRGRGGGGGWRHLCCRRLAEQALAADARRPTPANVDAARGELLGRATPGT